MTLEDALNLNDDIEECSICFREFRGESCPFCDRLYGFILIDPNEVGEAESVLLLGDCCELASVIPDDRPDFSQEPRAGRSTTN